VCGVLGSELDRVLDVVRVEEHVAQQIAHPFFFGTDELMQDRRSISRNALTPLCHRS